MTIIFSSCIMAEERKERKETTMKIPTLALPPMRKETLQALCGLALSGTERTRAQWKEESGISLTTVGRVAEAMQSASLLRERRSEGFGTGRKAGLLQSHEALRFLITRVETGGCETAVLDAKGREWRRERSPCCPDFTEEENLRVYRSAWEKTRKELEEQAPLVATALVVPRRLTQSPWTAENLSLWQSDCVLWEEELVDEAVRAAVGERTAYLLPRTPGQAPILYLRGERVRSEGEREREEREAWLRSVIVRWRAVKRLFPDAEAVLIGGGESPWTEEELIQRLRPRTDPIRLDPPHPTEQRALIHLKEQVIQRIVTATSKRIFPTSPL